jgi:hypothetical protein
MAKSLIAAARIAPFGKGTETLVDTKVRQTFEIDASQIQLSATWEKTIDEVVSRVATDLGLTDLQLRAEPYKLLLYERGGHFQRHRDSEKIDRMVGSLIVMLPSGFSGGELVIRHEGARETFSFEAARSESTPNYVAFYADCEHEVLRVDTGRRLPTSVDVTGAANGQGLRRVGWSHVGFTEAGSTHFFPDANLSDRWHVCSHKSDSGYALLRGLNGNRDLTLRQCKQIPSRWRVHPDKDYGITSKCKKTSTNVPAMQSDSQRDCDRAGGRIQLHALNSTNGP